MNKWGNTERAVLRHRETRCRLSPILQRVSIMLDIYFMPCVPCRISRCLTTARRHFAIFLSARGWPHRLMLMRNVQPDAKTSEWGPNFPWTARLIMCPWDTRSIMAASIAGYPFYAKWERTNRWPSGTGWPSALGRSLPDTPDTSRDHPPYPQNFFRAFHYIGWPSKSRWTTLRTIRPASLRSWPRITRWIYGI